MEEKPAVRGNLVGHEEVRKITEPQREQEAIPQATDPDAARAAELGGDVALGSRVVEFGLVRIDDGVVASKLAEVDARLVDLGFADRRDVTDQEERLSRAVHAADRRCNRSEAVREDEVAVEPALCRKAVGRKLARREKDRRFLAADLVAIDVDVAERVVLPQRLKLRERREQRTVVPETYGRDVGQIGPYICRGRRGADVERRFVDGVE